ncbi:MAG: AAA family ATPase, partial [Verrucomicrobiota bacterium]
DRLLPGLIDEMQVFRIEPFDSAQAISVLGFAADYFTQNERVHVAASAAQETYHLFHRFQPYVAFPGKAIQLMGTVVDQKVQERKNEVTPNDIRREFGAMTGLPDVFLREDIPLPFENIEKTFNDRIFGQSEAVSQVCRTITKFKAGLNDPGRPIGVMLFVGPTGVGKTQMAKQMGDYLFPNKPVKDRLIRLDMSEYAGHDASERLLGNVLGRPSDLVQKIRANPFSIVLLDEIEKASYDVFDVLMNVFDEGRLTDPLGRVTRFNSALLVMTSNLGATTSGPMGFSEEENEERPAVHTDLSAVKNFFRPEFFNRIDHVISFEPLGKSIIREITRLELGSIDLREGVQDRKLTLLFTDEVVAALAKLGFDPAYGVRPLQRVIEEHIVLPLARRLVGEPLREKTVHFDWDPDSKRVTMNELGS